MTYYSDVFTPETWAAFVADGAKTTAFRRASFTRAARRVQPGDKFVCYMKGEFSFVGALEARSVASLADEPIWGFEDFPVRVSVDPVALLHPSSALPLTALEGRLSFYPAGRQHFLVPAHFQGSPRRLSDQDGEAIWRAVLARDDGVRPPPPQPEEHVEIVVPGPKHAEVQALLAALGLAVGCEVWIPRNDRQAVGRVNSNVPDKLLAELPFLFPGRAQQVVQNIDAIWLRGSTVVAAFEVEHTTSIYSGLLRMSDLVALLPNINFPMYILAPESRRAAVRDEITRPTFAALPHPLARKCGFISSESLIERRATLGDATLRYLRPEFIHDVAEQF